MNAKRITVFEHDSLRLSENGLSKAELNSLQSYHEKMDNPYFTLIHNGVKFSQFVGVIQVGKLLIEVLPKADKAQGEAYWRTMLVDMLREVGVFQVKAPSSGLLNLKNNSILDLYFELFLGEVDHLLRMGLVKKYRSEESNKKALKGKLLFLQNIQKNFIHAERFYTRGTVFDVQNVFNTILCSALELVSRVNKNSDLSGRLGDIQLRFPDIPSRHFQGSDFDKIHYDRKTESYRTAIEIARLLLLNFHPDISAGKNHVLALMFDMNLLWEKFVFISMKRNLTMFGNSSTISAQLVRPFWKKDSGRAITIRPDIVLQLPDGKRFVIDTKWKNLSGKNPSPEDLRQMYVYADFFNANGSALVFPSTTASQVRGNYFSSDKVLSEKECSLIPVTVMPNVSVWQKDISQQIASWCKR